MRFHFFFLLISIMLLAACSGDKKETTAEKITSELADKSVEYIQEPIKKAHEAAALLQENSRQIQNSSQDAEE